MLQKRIHQLKTILETLLVFAVFAVFGSFPIPDSNEPYYIGKAIHFWNPDGLPGDTFLQSKDSHWTFYVVFGWLSFFLSPPNMALAGRTVTWLMLAWSWRRLSFALVPVRWAAIPGAMALAYYVDSFNMAGEWLVGGIEGKSIAFPFVFLGLEAIVRGKWSRVWIFLGIASAFHVLVGGWSAVTALGVAFLSQKKIVTAKTENPQASGKPKQFSFRLRSFSIFFGGLTALFGLIPALLLDYGAAPDIVLQAHQIYVFERLYHHLDPYQLPWTYMTRFFLLTAVWLLLCRTENKEWRMENGKCRGHCFDVFDRKNARVCKRSAVHSPSSTLLSMRWKRFEWFIWGTLLLSLFGMIVSFTLRSHKPLAAEILRFYWFRLADVAVPMGVALGALYRLIDNGKRIIKNDVNGSQTKRIFPLSFVHSCFFLLPFAVYLLADYLLFGRWFFSWRIPADQGIPWCVALLFCWGMSRFLPKIKRDSFSLIHYQFLLCAVILLYAPFTSFKTYADSRTRFAFSRTESGNPSVAYHWQDVCRWIADPEHTPAAAKFLVPRDAATFKWFAHRSDIGIWKEMPQDAQGIVAWQHKMHELFFYRNENGDLCEDRSLTILLWWKTSEEVEALRKKYGFEYIVCAKYPELSQHKNLQTVYENELFAVFYVVPL